MRAFLGLPAEASRHAPQVDGMIVSVHWLIAVLAVGFGLFFLFCLVRFNRWTHPRARRGGVPAAVAWTIAGAIALVELWELFFTAIPLWASRVSDFPPAESATVVRVVAEQFAWNVQYPGADGKFGRTDIRLIAPETTTPSEESCELMARACGSETWSELLARHDEARQSMYSTNGIHSAHTCQGRTREKYLSTHGMVNITGLPRRGRSSFGCGAR